MSEPNPETSNGADKLTLTSMPEQDEQSRGERFSHNLDVINKVIEGMLEVQSTDPAELEMAWAIRAHIAEVFIDSLEETPDKPLRRQRAQFSVMVDKASIFERTGDELRCLMELDTAEGFARYYELSDVIDSLAQELDDRVKELDDSPDALVLKLRGRMSFEKKELLHTLISKGIERADLIDQMRQIIVVEKGNPDEVFKDIGLTA